MQRVAVKPKLLRWARERTSRSIEDMSGRFKKLALWEREKAMPYSDQVTFVLDQMSEFQASEESLSPDVFGKAYKELASSYDSRYGGFGRAPKFPQAMTYSFLMRYWNRSERARTMPSGTAYSLLGGDTASS